MIKYLSVTSFTKFENQKTKINKKNNERNDTGELLYFISILHISNRALNLTVLNS